MHNDESPQGKPLFQALMEYVAPPLGALVVASLLKHLTTLPNWAVVLIAIPVGTVIGWAVMLSAILAIVSIFSRLK